MTGAPIGRRLDRLSEGRFAALTLLPGLILVGLVVLPPLVGVIGLSLFRIELLRDDFRPFVGLNNFLVRLPIDVEFLETFPRTLIFGVAATALAVPVALGSALLVNGRGRGANALGLLLLLPWAVAPIAAGVFWRMVFDTKYGLVNDALGALGLEKVHWETATPALIVTLVGVTWRATPLLAILLLGALRAVPPVLGRAARMDGASSWQVLRHVTLPSIRPTVIVVCVIQIVLSIQVFDILFAITRGNPAPHGDLTGFSIYASVIENLSFGYGSAQTLVLAAIIALCLLPLVAVIRTRTTRGLPADDDDADARPLPIAMSATGTAAAAAATAPVPQRPTEGRDAQRRPRLGPAWHRAGHWVAVALMVAWLLGPIVWLVVASTQPESALRSVPPALTTQLTFDGYTRLVRDPEWSGALFNSIVVSVGATLLALAAGILAGYPLARIRFRGSRIVLLALLLTQLIPPIALAIPVLILFIAFGLRGTVPGLILVNAAFWTPILVWLIRAAFMAVPVSIEKAARMDGAGRLATILRIAVPSAAPAIAAAAVIVFIGVWNDFVFVATIGNKATSTLPRFLTVTADPPYHVISAGILVTILPCLVLVAVMHRRILRAV